MALQIDIMCSIKRVIFLCVVILVSPSCFILADRWTWSFKFYNNSDQDVYFIIDFNTQDQVLTPDVNISWAIYTKAHNWIPVDSGHTRCEVIITDAADIYVVDATKIDPSLRKHSILEDKTLAGITEDMFLYKTRVYHSDFIPNYPSFYYPPL